MLSLPRKLIFGDQPKLDFKLSETEGIARLYSERHIPYLDSRYWSRFLQFETPSDIFSLLSLADVRKARQHAPENVVTLVRVMVAHLESLLLDPKFCPPPLQAPTGSVDTFAGRLGGMADVSKWRVPGFDSQDNRSGQDLRDRTREALNVIRVLTRVLPAVLESTNSSFETDVLWSQSPQAYGDRAEAGKRDASATTPAHKASSNVASSASDNIADSQFVIEDDDEKDEDNATSKVKEVKHPLGPEEQTSKAEKHQHEDEEDIPVALGERLIRLTVDLLFCSGFTIPWTEDQILEASRTGEPHNVNHSIWEAGVGSSVDLQGTSRQHVSNRVEVLRLLLVLLSKTIYIPAESQNSVVDPSLRFAVQDLERSAMLPLLCSLINTSISNARNSTAAWLGLPNVGGLVAGTNDEVRSALVTTCLQILDVLLTYDPPTPGETDTVSLSTIGAPLPGPGGRNVFRFYLSKLHRVADFEFIWSGMSKAFNEHVNSSIQILAIQIPTAPGRRATEASWQLNQIAERLTFLWRLLEHNHKFRIFLLDDAKRAPELLTYLLYFALTYKDNMALQGLVRLCAFILQDVSSERAFAINLAKAGSAAKVSLPSRLGLIGGNTAVDFLVQGAYALIATTKGQLSGLYPPLAIALSNTAPFWRSISITSSTRVIHLLRNFSQPSFLLSDEGNPRLLFYILETINSVMTCQYNANPNLVYALVLAHKLLDGLEEFSLRRGVEEIWNRRRALGTDTRDWFENAPRLEKPPLPPSSSQPASGASNATDQAGGEQGDENAAAPTTAEKGKMRRISTSSAEAAKRVEWEGELSKYAMEVVEEVAAAYVGKNGFQPTQAWVESWQTGLPLHTPRLVVDKLLPEVERISAGGSVRAPGSNGSLPATEITGGSTDARVLAYLREQQMSDYLPPPSNGIHARPWQWTQHATVWLRSYLWGTIYVSALLPYGLWSDTDIRLFRIHERPDPRRQASSGGAAGNTSSRSNSGSATTSPVASRPASQRPSLTGSGSTIELPSLSPNGQTAPSAAPAAAATDASNTTADAESASNNAGIASVTAGAVGSIWNATKELGRLSISRSSTPKPSASAPPTTNA